MTTAVPTVPEDALDMLSEKVSARAVEAAIPDASVAAPNSTGISATRVNDLIPQPPFRRVLIHPPRRTISPWEPRVCELSHPVIRAARPPVLHRGRTPAARQSPSRMLRTARSSPRTAELTRRPAGCSH